MNRAVQGLGDRAGRRGAGSGQAPPGNVRRPMAGGAIGRGIGASRSGLIPDIGYLLVLWTPRRQRLHDQMASTRVVRTPPAP